MSTCCRERTLRAAFPAALSLSLMGFSIVPPREYISPGKHNSRALSDNFLIQDAQKQKYANAFAVGGMLTLLTSWHHNGFDLSLDEMEDLARRLLTQPLFVRQNIQG